MKPSTECIERANPGVARDRSHATLAEMNHEALKVGSSDRGGIGRQDRGGRERFPRALIPFAGRNGDVVDVVAFAEELLQERIELVHEARQSFLT